MKAACDVDLFDIGVFDKLGNDPGLIIETISALVSDQLAAKGLTKEQFQDSLTGDGIQAASDVLIQEIIDFFPTRRRNLLNKVKATADQVVEQAEKQINEKLNSPDLLKQLMQSLNHPSGAAPESAASTPAISPSDNSP